MKMIARGSAGWQGQGRIVMIPLALVCSACGIGALGGATAPAPELRGSVEAAGTRPLLVDWGPNDRVLLDDALTKPPLVVHYEPGKLEPLFDCRTKGRYAYAAERSMQVQDDIIETADELHAKMPAFGAKFEGDLARAGKLHVRMKVVGSFDADQPSFDVRDLVGNCAGATHVASHMTVGAFRLFTLSKGSLKGDVSVPAVGAGVGGGSSSDERNLNEGGDETKCAASGDDKRPPDGCTTALQLVLAPLVGLDVSPAAAPGWSTQKTVALIAGGVGLAGVVVGSIFGLRAFSSWSQAQSDCSQTCGPGDPAQNEKSDAQTAATISTISFVLGGLGLGAGALLFFTAPSASPFTMGRVGARPMVAHDGGGLSVDWRF